MRGSILIGATVVFATAAWPMLRDDVASHAAAETPVVAGSGLKTKTPVKSPVKAPDDKSDAQKSDGEKSDTEKSDKTKASKGVKPAESGFTPEREAAALTFVRQHHAELADLLVRLKERRPQEYQKAIRDLFRVSERLAQSHEQQPPRYDLELEEWKLQSRIQLLVARITMNRTPELERELLQLLTEQLEVRRELLALNHQRAAAKAESLADELRRLDDRKADMVRESFEKALQSAGQKKQALKAAKEPNPAATAP